MAKAIPKSTDDAPRSDIQLPPPVPDGTYVVEDLGRFVNWVTRAHRTQERIDREIVESGVMMSEREWESQGGDPEPVEPPPPIPDGDDIGTRGGRPEDYETK